MTATVDFKPFADGVGANVLSQADYEAALAGALSDGFQAGLAKSDQTNKVWRQSSVMAAAVAQAISNLTGDNVLDNGDVAAVVTTFTNALSGFIQNKTYPTGSVGKALQLVVNPANAPYNAVGGGADDTVAIQAAIDYAQTLAAANTGKRVVVWLDEYYLVARNSGANDRWGVKVASGGNITIAGPGGLGRYNTNITADVDAYPPLFIGVPDSDVAATTPNVTIDGITFIGQNTNHGVQGNVIHDLRTAIEVKNTTNLRVVNCNFLSIDSSAIFYQQPGTINNTTHLYYNKTKSYQTKVTGNHFVAASHSTPGRAFIHAIAWSGVDGCLVDDNDFVWCDDCVAGEGTYNMLSDIESNTYAYTTPASAVTLGQLKRCGRSWQFTNNRCFNSSEHVYYGAGMDCTCANNTINNDHDTICTSSSIKERSRGSVISGNRVSNYPSGILVDSPAFDVAINGNGGYCTQQGAQPSAAITVQTDDLKTYIDARPWFTGYTPMGNITGEGNTFSFATGAGTGQVDIGIVVYTNVGADATTWPEGMIQNVSFRGNTFRNCKYGHYVVGEYHRGVKFANSLFAKPFVSAGFTGSTTMNTACALLINDASPSAGIYIDISGMQVYGCTTLVSTISAGGTNVQLPWGMLGMKMFYVKNFKSADFLAVQAINQFQNNAGYYFLDRTSWAAPFSLQNALNDGTNANSPFKYNIGYNGTNVLFYTDDSGTTITLG